MAVIPSTIKLPVRLQVGDGALHDIGELEIDVQDLVDGRVTPSVLAPFLREAADEIEMASASDA